MTFSSDEDLWYSPKRHGKNIVWFQGEKFFLCTAFNQINLLIAIVDGSCYGLILSVTGYIFSIFFILHFYSWCFFLISSSCGSFCLVMVCAAHRSHGRGSWTWLTASSSVSTTYTRRVNDRWYTVILRWRTSSLQTVSSRRLATLSLKMYQDSLKTVLSYSGHRLCVWFVCFALETQCSDVISTFVFRPVVLFVSECMTNSSSLSFSAVSNVGGIDASLSMSQLSMLVSDSYIEAERLDMKISFVWHLHVMFSFAVACNDEWKHSYE